MSQAYIVSCENVNTLRCLTNNNLKCNFNWMKLSDRLKAARDRAGLTQEQLSKKSGVAQQVISKLENGKQQETAGIVKIAIACGVRPEWLDMEQGEMVDGLYVHDEKLKQLLKVAQELPEYGKDKAIKEVIDLAEFIKTASNAEAQK